MNFVADSLSGDSWSDETVYTIELLRLERWIIENTEKFLDTVLLAEVARLKQEAEDFATSGDFALATIWLETIWEALHSVEALNGDAVVSTLDLGKSPMDNFSLSPTPKLRWSRELTSGVDFWRQQFQFAFVQGDSTFIESSGNPFTGVRIGFDHISATNRSIQGGASLRYSRDYLSGDATVRLSNPLGKTSAWTIRNRFEGNAFYGDFDLKYVQNVSEIGFDFAEIGPLSLNLEDEFVLRSYDKDNASNPSYLNNELRSFLKLKTGLGSFFGGGYRNVQRLHRTHDEYDYRENRVEFLWYQTIQTSISLAFEAEVRWRDYLSRSFNEILQDHTESYFRGELRLPLGGVVGTEIRGSVTNRDYPFINATSLPDYLIYDVEPELYLNLGSAWRLSAGFFYNVQTYQNFRGRVDAVSVDAAASIPFDNNQTFGPTFTIEFFQVNGIMFSLRESFHLQRYPNTPTNNLLFSNPYSDRNMNSLLFFLSWDLNRSWRFTALANVDHDRSRRQDSGDFQNTIVGLEANYSF